MDVDSSVARQSPTATVGEPTHCFYCEYDITGVSTSHGSLRVCPECGYAEASFRQRLDSLRKIDLGLTLLAWAIPFWVVARRFGVAGLVYTRSRSSATGSSDEVLIVSETRVQMVMIALMAIGVAILILARAHPAPRLVRRATLWVVAAGSAVFVLRFVPILNTSRGGLPTPSSGSSEWVSPRAWDYYASQVQLAIVAMFAGLLFWNLAHVAAVVGRLRWRRALLAFAVVCVIGYVPLVKGVEAAAGAIRASVQSALPSGGVSGAPGVPFASADPLINENLARLVDRVEPLVTVTAAVGIWVVVLALRPRVRARVDAVLSGRVV